MARDGRPLVVIADEVEGQMLAALIANSLRGSMKVVAVKAPRYGEERRSILGDLALATLVELLLRDSLALPLGQHLRWNILGAAKSVDITKFSTTIVGGKADYQLVEKKDRQSEITDC